MTSLNGHRFAVGTDRNKIEQRVGARGSFRPLSSPSP
jgi:hypothetical protein